MKLSGTKVILAATVLVCLAACQPPADGQADSSSASQGPPDSAALPTVFEMMTQVFTPQSNKLWELAGSLYGNDGELDAKLLSDLQWQELAGAATGLLDASRLIQGATAVRVAAAGVKIQTEGTPGGQGAAQVQALIDADLQGFKEQARQLAAIAEDALAAATAHDAAKSDEVSNRLNEACTACHSRYWYPEQSPQ